jgi:Rod binding domain-containing protein
MNVVPLNATTPDATSRLAELAVRRAPGAKPLSGEALRKASPEVQRHEVAAQFEAILVRQLLGPTMTSMLGKDSGAAGSVYGDMLTDTFAQQLTRSGGGLGLSRLLEQQLTPRGHAAPAQTPSP